MRPSPLILAAMLVAAVTAGCGDETPVVPDQSSYRQTTSTTSTTTYASSQGQYVDPYQTVATASSTATTSAVPAGTGVKAQVTSSQTRGLFKKTLEVTVTVQNQDTVEHSGYLVITFLDSAGKAELAYRYLTLAPNGIETVTVASVNPAASGAAVFKERFL
ncbi:MAG TPA: hypothetical protein V6D05_08595 [Stenomitos sp.]